MLASRVLPPIFPASPPPPDLPVATFFNIPRRYIKSTAHMGDNPANAQKRDSKSRQLLQKSNEVIESRSISTSHQTRTTNEGLPSPDPSLPSPVSGRKRIAHFRDRPIDRDTGHVENPVDSQLRLSVSSAGSGELSTHICLCQPEPKIPRPRNGKCDRALYLSRRLSQSPEVIRWQTKQCALCLQVCIAQTMADEFLSI